MKRPIRLRAWLLAPLVYLAALLLLLEEWFWDTGARLMRAVAAWPPLAALEARIGALPPYGALCLFALPAILLFPVKLLALLAIAHGHAVTGVLVIVAAKLGGAAAVARIYLITRPRLLTIAWFARWHDKFMALKERWIGRLRASAAYRYASLVARRIGRLARDLRARIRQRLPGGRHAAHPLRVVRRLLAMWRARRKS
jgi:hypothetical protein